MTESDNKISVSASAPYVINSYGVDSNILAAGTEIVKKGGIRHIAFIMDGNGRWATSRGLPRESGHKVGMDSFERVVEYCADIGIKYVTVYAFSTENWKRPKHEVDAILLILRQYLKRALKVIHEKKVHFVVIGDVSVFDKKTKDIIAQLDRESSCYDRVLNIALNYGGRSELVHAVNEAIKEKMMCGDTSVSEDDIERHLYTAGCPDPDLIVRTAGDLRLSNFLLWQSSYSELVFSRVLWPDYRPENVNDDLNEFMSRKRRFGGVESTVGASE